MRALSVAAGVVLALLLSAHLAIAIGLLRRRQWRRAAVSLVIPPLAPVWGFEAGLRVPAWLWVGAFTAYAIAVALA